MGLPSGTADLLGAPRRWSYRLADKASEDVNSWSGPEKRSLSERPFAQIPGKSPLEARILVSVILQKSGLRSNKSGRAGAYLRPRHFRDPERHDSARAGNGLRDCNCLSNLQVKAAATNEKTADSIAASRSLLRSVG